MTGWWFGTWLCFFHILGRIIPTDFYIVQRGRYTTNQLFLDYGNEYDSILEVNRELNLVGGISTPLKNMNQMGL